MKKIIALGVVILSIVGVYRFFQDPVPASEQKINTISVSEKPVVEPSVEKKLVTPQSVLFVPYWNPTVDTQTKNEYDTFVYFGVSVNKDGTIKQDEGYARIEDFQESTGGKKQLLTLRMLDTDTNHAVLEDTALQESIITDLIPILTRYDFDGLVLDLEVSSLPLTDVRNNISLFIQRMGEVMGHEDMHFAVTIYGDVYYRARPYDVKAIGDAADEIMIMAYDFHKSRGEAGPNFPLAGRSVYGYDFDTMISDYTHDVPAEKLTILLGMYGYDWALGPQGKPLKAARAIPLSDIRSMTLPSCDLSNCKKVRDPETKEAMMSYTDDDGYRHELWYEDEDSVEVKTEFLREKGIESVGYWVYGYF